MSAAADHPRDVLHQLGPLRVRVLLRALGRQANGPLDTMELSAGEWLLLWVAAWLDLRKPVGATERDFILTQLARPIASAGADAATQLASSGRLAATQLLILDGALVTMSGLSHYLNLKTGEEVSAVRKAPIETVACNLTALYAMHAGRRPRHDPKPEEATPCPPRP